MASADSTIANVATPSIRHSLDASGSDAQFVVGGYLVFTGLRAHLPGAASREHAPDIGGVSATAGQLGASIGVAGFGTLYLTLAATHRPGHAFGITAVAFGTAALLATVPTHLATRRTTSTGPAAAQADKATGRTCTKHARPIEAGPDAAPA